MGKGRKTLNPADKARKEARKKELKKNKKQRQQVRSAVIESRDPEQVIADLDSLDKLEFDVEKIGSVTNDILFKDKRKRLKEAWSRILGYYEKEDPDKHKNLKKLEQEYESRHKAIKDEYTSLKAAREVKIEDVFLPPEPNVDSSEVSDFDPLMSSSVVPPSDLIDLPGMSPDLGQFIDNIKNSLQPSIPQGLPFNPLAPPPRRHHQERHDRFAERRSKHFVTDKTPGDLDKSEQIDKDRKQPVPVKSAVIESKPVIFMQKATKFVPASVRKKINPQPHPKT